MTILIKPWLAAYLDGVAARHGEAIDVARERVRYADESEPIRSHCHENVDRWVTENPEYEPVRGWAISGHGYQSVLLDAHSVVRRPDRTLVDITLSPSDQWAPFIPHLGSEDEFARAVEQVKQIFWPCPE